MNRLSELLLLFLLLLFESCCFGAEQAAVASSASPVVRARVRRGPLMTPHWTVGDGAPPPRAGQHETQFRIALWSAASLSRTAYLSTTEAFKLLWNAIPGCVDQPIESRYR